MKSAKFWLVFGNELGKITRRLTKVWPPELPPEHQSDSELFWMAACREEMRLRQTLSAQIRTLLNQKEFPSMSPLESWLLRRRVEWAAQLAVAKSEAQIQPSVPMAQVLEWALVTSWESDGCIGMWQHAERAGKLHPEAPDWLRGLK